MIFKHRDSLKKEVKNKQEGFGGSVVKNLPANVGDMGFVPGLGTFHMLWSNEAHVPQLLRLHSIAHEPQLPEPVHLESMLRNKEAAARRS